MAPTKRRVGRIWLAIIAAAAIIAAGISPANATADQDAAYTDRQIVEAVTFGTGPAATFFAATAAAFLFTVGTEVAVVSIDEPHSAGKDAYVADLTSLLALSNT